MTEDLIKTIKSLQLKIDVNKMALEQDKEVQLFVKLLADCVEAWNIIFHWKQHPKPLVVVEPIHFDFAKLKSEILPIVSKSYYVREFAYSFFEQYEGLETYSEKIKKINGFLKEALNQNLLELKNECMLFCSECGKAIVTNRIDEKDRCSCGSLFDFKFYLASIPSKIIEEIITGHLLEMYALHVMKMMSNVKLIGMEIGDSKERCIYTSIEYADIGVEDKVNGEIDLLGLTNNSLIAVECKFNETTYGDIKDFMGVSEKLLLKVKEKSPDVKMSRIIFSYDGAKLRQVDTLVVISLKNASSTNDLVREINQRLR
jgi:hypothetical protein